MLSATTMFSTINYTSEPCDVCTYGMALNQYIGTVSYRYLSLLENQYRSVGHGNGMSQTI